MPGADAGAAAAFDDRPFDDRPGHGHVIGPCALRLQQRGKQRGGRRGTGPPRLRRTHDAETSTSRMFMRRRFQNARLRPRWPNEAR